MKPRRKKAPSRTLIGWREWVALPDLGVHGVKAKIDTGARTSAIHAWHIQPFELDGEAWVGFELHPLQRNNQVRIRCCAPVAAKRRIRNSGGVVQDRHIISTNIWLGRERWPIELSLTTRDEMGFRMLLGRAALRGRMIIDPAKSFLLPYAKSRSDKIDSPI